MEQLICMCFYSITHVNGYLKIIIVTFMSNVKIHRALITESMLIITEHVTAINNLASKNLLITHSYTYSLDIDYYISTYAL